MAAVSNVAMAISAFDVAVASNGLLIGATGITASLTITTSASTA
jgi:hypothetical protein